MTDFLLELLTEEIPARMQARAIEQLIERFTAGVAAAALPIGAVAGMITPRRLVLQAAEVAAASAGTSDERRGPRTDAPDAAIAGFVKSTGMAREAMAARDTPKGRFLYATIVTPGRSAAAIIADLIPGVIRDFDWPKSMRWGDASISTASPRWVRPLSGIVALLGDAVVPFAAAGIASGRTTVGHRFLSSGPIEIASAATYVDQLRAAYVMLDRYERFRVIIGGATYEARSKGLTYVKDDALARENAGLTEWPIPLIGEFDPAFLDVPREVIQLTMRTNQKYFACTDAGGALAPAFICVANIAADDDGAAIVAGNEKVLAARLADAKFFWDADLARVRDGGLVGFTPKLADIVFHEKLGTVADKVERVAKLARWLVESGAVGTPPPGTGGVGGGQSARSTAGADSTRLPTPDPSRSGRGAELADLAETAARLCKADLVSATVGEFPEVQGIAGGHLATAEGLDPEIAAAIRDHYKPVGPSDDVPTAPVTVAVALADKLDTLLMFLAVGEWPSGSRDPYALRRAAISILATQKENHLRILSQKFLRDVHIQLLQECIELAGIIGPWRPTPEPPTTRNLRWFFLGTGGQRSTTTFIHRGHRFGPFDSSKFTPTRESLITSLFDQIETGLNLIDAFFIDRLKVQQREAGIRPDVIDAVFSLNGEDDLVRLVARATALQAVLQTPDGASLLTGYRRGANIVRIEEAKEPGVSDGAVDPDRLSEPAEIDLNAALDAAVPEVAAAVADERFESAMSALARLRPAVDAFFTHVTVNAADTAVRRNRLALLARLRTAVHSVADFSKLDG